MALNKGFGRQLRDARVSSGLTYGTISRKLRIRSDILQAIEEEDFTTIPPIVMRGAWFTHMQAF